MNQIKYNLYLILIVITGIWILSGCDKEKNEGVSLEGFYELEYDSIAYFNFNGETIKVKPLLSNPMLGIYVYIIIRNGGYLVRSCCDYNCYYSYEATLTINKNGLINSDSIQFITTNNKCMPGERFPLVNGNYLPNSKTIESTCLTKAEFWVEKPGQPVEHHIVDTQVKVRLRKVKELEDAEPVYIKL